MDIADFLQSESGRNNRSDRMEQRNHSVEFWLLFPHKFHFAMNHKGPKPALYSHFPRPDNQ